jgi:hypothetical protein
MVPVLIPVAEVAEISNATQQQMLQRIEALEKLVAVLARNQVCITFVFVNPCFPFSVDDSSARKIHKVAHLSVKTIVGPSKTPTDWAR